MLKICSVPVRSLTKMIFVPRASRATALVAALKAEVPCAVRSVSVAVMSEPASVGRDVRNERNGIVPAETAEDVSLPRICLPSPAIGEDGIAECRVAAHVEMDAGARVDPRSARPAI
jgi:hypothetical protein